MAELTQELAEYFRQGNSFRTITQARSWAGDKLGEKINFGTPQAKELEETIEESLIEVAKEIIESEDEISAYHSLVDLYQRQPRLGTRTSSSVANQAYSTPLPIAYLANRLAGIGQEDSVFEPSAGNGALLLEADPQNVQANELDFDRAKALQRQGYKTTTFDATTYRPDQKVDVVVANPPFGRVKEKDGSNKTWDTGKYHTKEIDHAISLNALSSLKDDGRAVLIIGGVKGLDPEARGRSYNSRQNRAFFKSLYDDYNVTEHFSLDGSLYNRQGANYPIDVIAIDGKGKSALPYPAVDVPPVHSSFAEIEKEVLTKYVSRSSQLLDTNRGTNRVRIPGGNRSVDSNRSSQSPSENKDSGFLPELAIEEGRVSDSPTQQYEVGSGYDPAESTGTDGSTYRGENRGEFAESDQYSNFGSLRDSQRLNGGERVAQGEPEPSSAGGLSPEDSGEKGGDSAGSDGNKRHSTTGMAGTSENQRDQPSLNLGGIMENTQDLQTPWEPISKGKSFNALVPSNMHKALRKRLLKLEKNAQQEGYEDLDDWVVGKMNSYVAGASSVAGSGEWDKDRLYEALSAEQIEGVALGIDNYDKDGEVVLGDDTGFGKSRQLAAITQYARQQGSTPIVVTKDNNLYRDVVEGFEEIGVEDVKPFCTDSNLNLRLHNGERIKYGKDSHDKEMEEMIASGDLKGDYNAIFTTYSQMQTVRGEEPRRRDLLRTFAPSSFLALDESHSAGAAPDRNPWSKDPLNAAEFARELKKKSKRTFSASATYAKDPNMMDFYSRTGMGAAVEDINSLIRITTDGGLPMQQVLANELTEAGQYVRRERSFEGVDFDAEVVEASRELTNAEANVMAAIRDFDDCKQSTLKSVDNLLKAEAKEVLGDNATGKAGADSQNFASLMHNYLNASTLAKKIDGTIDKSLEALDKGEKPFVAISRTSESFFGRYAEENDIKPGDPIDANLGDMLRHYAERSREVITRDAYGETTRRRLSDEELSTEALDAWDEIERLIDETDFTSVPASPIDWYKCKMEEAGYSIGEMTGRSSYIDYQKQEDGNYLPVYQKRSSRDTGKAALGKTVDQFQSGEIDGAIGNQVASTGISLHASEKAQDQRRRRFLLVQPEGDVNVAKQFFGRVHRTGQTKAPHITIVSGDIPHEKRQTAILMNKMSSLAANTTANAESQVNFGDAIDMFNEIGDEVAADIVEEDPELSQKLSHPIKPYEGNMRRVTGRMPMLDLEEQEELIGRLETDYQDRVRELKSIGAYELDAEAEDLDAVTLASAELQPSDPGSDSPFTQGVDFQIVSIKNNRQPPKTLDVVNGVREKLGLAEVDEVEDHVSALDEVKALSQKHSQGQIEEVVQSVLDYKKKKESLFKTDGQKENFNNKIDGQAEKLKEVIQNYPVGETVKVQTPNNMVMYGVIQGHSYKGSENANPVAPSSWKTTVAVADQARELKIPHSKMGEMNSYRDYKMKPQKVDDFDQTPVYRLFDERQTSGREQRGMIKGNLLRASEKYLKEGKVSIFTNSEGEIEQGILMKKGFSIEEHLEKMPIRIPDVESVKKLTKEYKKEVSTKDKNLTIEHHPSYTDLDRTYLLSTPKSKSKGGQYFLDQDLLAAADDEFVSVGNRMEAYVTEENLGKVVDYLNENNGLYAKEEDNYLAREIVGLELPDTESLQQKADEAEEELEQQISRASSGRVGVGPDSSDVILGSKMNMNDDPKVKVYENGTEKPVLADDNEEVEEPVLADDEVETYENGTEKPILADDEVETDSQPVTQNEEVEEPILTNNSEESENQVEEKLHEVVNLNEIGDGSQPQPATHNEEEVSNEGYEVVEVVDSNEIVGSEVVEEEVEESTLASDNHEVETYDNGTEKPILADDKVEKPTLTNNSEQQNKVEQVAPVVADYLKLKGKSKVEGKRHTSSLNEESRTVALVDNKTKETVMKAKYDGEKWQDLGSNLSDKRTDYFTKRVGPKVKKALQKREQEKLSQEKVEKPILASESDSKKVEKPILADNNSNEQQEKVSKVAPVVSSYLKVAGEIDANGKLSKRGSKHTCEYDYDDLSITLTDSQTEEIVMKAKYDGGEWKDLGSNLSDKRADYFTERVGPKVKEALEKSKQQQMSQHSASKNKRQSSQKEAAMAR